MATVGRFTMQISTVDPSCWTAIESKYFKYNPRVAIQEDLIELVRMDCSFLPLFSVTNYSKLKTASNLNHQAENKHLIRMNLLKLFN